VTKNARSNNMQSAVDELLHLLRNLDLSKVDLGCKIDDFLEKIRNREHNFITFST